MGCEAAHVHGLRLSEPNRSNVVKLNDGVFKVKYATGLKGVHGHERVQELIGNQQVMRNVEQFQMVYDRFDMAIFPA